MSKIDAIYFYLRNRFAFRSPVIYNFFEKRKGFIKFFLVGCCTGALDLLVLFILHGICRINIVPATSIAFVLSFLLSFILQKRWTFREFGHKNTPRQLVVYIANTFFDLNLNALLMYLLVNRLAWWYILSQVLVNLAIGLLNFIIYKYLIFRKR